MTDGVPAASLAIDQRENRSHYCPMLFQGRYRFERARAGGERILDDYDGRPLREPPFDPSAGTMLLGSLANGEGVHGVAFQPASMSDGVGDGIRAHGQTTHPANGSIDVSHGFEAHDPDQRLAMGRHRGPTGVDVVGRTGPAGKGKVTDGEGSFDQEVAEVESVVHFEEVTDARSHVKRRGRIPGFMSLVLVVSLTACDGTTTVNPNASFGQTGRIQVEVRSLLPAADGQLDEILIWASNGPWLLTERVSYKGSGGAETIRSSRLNPGELSREYASLVRQLNEAPGLSLFDGTVPQELEPECGVDLPSTEVILTIEDDPRDEVAVWTRCAVGTLLPPTTALPRNTIEPGTAAPDAGAARVITAAQLTRSFTLGEAFTSTYGGTYPFSVLEQGEDSPARREAPQAFVSSNQTPPAAFVSFWEEHAGPEVPLPNVAWDSELVLLAVVGRRNEAGEEVRVRRVLPLGPVSGTRIELTERIPGDFCSPAAKLVHPYQLVVVPKEGVFLPISFPDPEIERISCGA